MTQTETKFSEQTTEFLTVLIADQKFGIPVLQIQDVLREQKVTRIPLASHEVVGSLNLRGRIVTAIDLRKRLNVPIAEGSRSMSVVVEHNQELYSLIIDKVGDVIRLDGSKIEKNPGTLDAKWREISCGVCQLDRELLIIMDVSRLLDSIHDRAA
ncbi:MAG: chemotaxis protein CheW [Rhodospirillales bacterium]|nr:chemotaxis protein CheW [Alphaproteobacteria bacterium]MCB1839351.1 chemotaxis protein CheW [Alphaproteobacteria bacterium]MCB9976282.1 chemotaxis protein CheW [Rhodospirillales bacterium]